MRGRRWPDLTADLRSALVQGCHSFVDELLEAIRKGGSDAT
jgi:hypothetical protein